MAQEVSTLRMMQAGAVPIDTAAVLAEIQKTWKRDDAEKWAKVWTRIFTNYELLLESYAKAKFVTETNEVWDTDRP